MNIDTMRFKRMFSSNYKQHEFKDGIFSDYWNLCVRAISDDKFNILMKQNNDIGKIPPVVTFVDYYNSEIMELSQSNILPNELKKSIGAFFGCYFQFYLKEYKQSKTKRLNLNTRRFRNFTLLNFKNASLFVK